MLEEFGADYKEYERKLREMAEPILSQLSQPNNHRKVVWLNQFPTNDFWAPNKQHNTDIYSEKIHQYNLIIPRVFRYKNL